jgi:hypothetical protein
MMSRALPAAALTMSKEAVVVGQRGLDERDVDREDPPLEEAGDLRQEDRRVVGEAGVDGGPRVLADEEGVEAEVRLEPFVGVGGHAERPDLDDLGIEERLRVRLDVIGQGLHEVLRLAARRAEEDPVAPPDVGEHRLLGQELVRILRPEPIQVVGSGRWHRAALPALSEGSSLAAEVEGLPPGVPGETGYNEAASLYMAVPSDSISARA